MLYLLVNPFASKRLSINLEDDHDLEEMNEIAHQLGQRFMESMHSLGGDSTDIEFIAGIRKIENLRRSDPGVRRALKVLVYMAHDLNGKAS